MVDYIRNMAIFEQPDYDYIRGKIAEAAEAENINLPLVESFHKFNWDFREGKESQHTDVVEKPQCDYIYGNKSVSQPPIDKYKYVSQYETSKKSLGFEEYKNKRNMMKQARSKSKIHKDLKSDIPSQNKNPKLRPINKSTTTKRIRHIKFSW